MLCFGHQWSSMGRWMSGGRVGGCSLHSQNYLARGFMIKKKLLSLMIESAEILNHLGVVHL